jgi:hypothetical protein
MNSMTRPRAVDEHITTVYAERFGLGTGRAHWEGNRVQVNTRITGDPTIDDSNRPQGFIRNYKALQDRVHHLRIQAALVRRPVQALIALGGVHQYPMFASLLHTIDA